jgi:hypothetical protein
VLHKELCRVNTSGGLIRDRLRLTTILPPILCGGRIGRIGRIGGLILGRWLLEWRRELDNLRKYLLRVVRDLHHDGIELRPSTESEVRATRGLIKRNPAIAQVLKLQAILACGGNSVGQRWLGALPAIEQENVICCSRIVGLKLKSASIWRCLRCEAIDVRVL